MNSISQGSLFIALIIAFFAGVTSFLSPCVLPLVPGYLSFITGFGSTEEKKFKRSSALIATFLFILGFSLVFVSIGMFFGSLGGWLIKNGLLIERTFGFIIIILGLNYLGIINIFNRLFFMNDGFFYMVNGEITKEQLTNIESIDFDVLLKFINNVFGRSFKIINDNVRKKYYSLLKKGYTKEQIKNAIENASKNKFHIENNFQYCTPEFFSRSETIDKYSNVTEIQKPMTEKDFIQQQDMELYEYTKQKLGL